MQPSGGKSAAALMISVLLSLSAACLAATSSAKKEESWYQIEVIIFAYDSGLSNNSERWHDKITLNYPEDLVVLKQPQPATLLQRNLATDSDDAASAIPAAEAAEFSPLDAPTTTELNHSQDGAFAAPDLTEIDISSLPQRLAEPTDLRQAAFTRLPQSYFQLSGTKGRIDRALDMRLLAHFAWRQPVAPASAPIFVQVGQQYGFSSELEGFIRLSKNRYLHFDTHLFYSTFKERLPYKPMDWEIFSEAEATKMPLNAADFGAGQGRLFDLFDPLETNFQRDLTAHYESKQRIDENKIHYLDHPLFGLLVMVSPHQLPDPVMDMPDFDLDALPIRKEVARKEADQKTLSKVSE